MKLSKALAKKIGLLILDKSIYQDWAVSTVHNADPAEFNTAIQRHDAAVQGLRDLGITKEFGPCKYNETEKK